MPAVLLAALVPVHLRVVGAMGRSADSLVGGFTELSSSVFGELPIRTGDWTAARTSRLDNPMPLTSQHL
jgi:hypothetical protein